MSMHTSTGRPWNQLRRAVTTHPEKFAGGSAAAEPLGLLTVELELRLGGRQAQ